MIITMQLAQSTTETASSIIAMLTFISLMVSNYLGTHHHVKFIWIRVAWTLTDFIALINVVMCTYLIINWPHDFFHVFNFVMALAIIGLAFPYSIKQAKHYSRN